MFVDLTVFLPRGFARNHPYPSRPLGGSRALCVVERCKRARVDPSMFQAIEMKKEG